MHRDMNVKDMGVALITGGASGIGFAAATQLGQLGYTIVVLGSSTQSGSGRLFNCVNLELTRRVRARISVIVKR